MNQGCWWCWVMTLITLLTPNIKAYQAQEVVKGFLLLLPNKPLGIACLIIQVLLVLSLKDILLRKQSFNQR